MKVFLGCSGYYYKDWEGLFYPDDLPKKDWLSYYTQHFNTVEINSSFYHLPKAKTLENWNEITPKDFKITLKGSRYVTHMRKLLNCQEPIANFYHLADILGEKVGCILWQLPGNFHYNQERLTSFCDTLSSAYSNVIEFRHVSWFNEEVYKTLQQKGIVVCAVSAPINLPEELIQTNGIVYIRIHGKRGWYNDKYSDEELKVWAKRIQELRPKVVYAYFNNDYHTYAVENCRSFAKML